MKWSRTWALMGCLLLLNTGQITPVYAEGEPVQSLVVQRGPVKATVSIEPISPIIGDIITLILEVVAEEGVELLMPEFGQSLDRFSIVDFVPKESVDDEGRNVAIHRYRLQSRSSGQQTIPPLMIEFVDRRPGNRAAPEGEDAYELLTERIVFEIESVLPKGAGADLKPPLRELGPRDDGGAKLWPWLLAVLGILAIASPFAWQAWQRWQVQARQRSAYDIAHSRLSKLTAADNLDVDAVQVFFVELSDIVRHYLEDRFNLHAPELTTEEFLDVAASSPDLSGDQKSFLQGFLRSADQVKFARHVPDVQTMDKALAAAAGFLEQTKQNSPLIGSNVVDSNTVHSNRDTHQQPIVKTAGGENG